MIKLGEDWHYPCLMRADGTATAWAARGDIALRPAAAQHQNGVTLHIELRIVDAGVEVFNAVEDQSASAMLDEVPGRSCRLDDGAGQNDVLVNVAGTEFRSVMARQQIRPHLSLLLGGG
jgi:hypothetical protein